MIYFSIWWRYSLIFLAFCLPIGAYGSEKAEDIFEKPKEKKVGPNTTFFITPEEVKQHYRTYHRIDRSVTKMDRFTLTEQHNYNMQDLGNHWTAAQPIFYTLPQHIGTTYGCHAYDYYFQKPQCIRYYHTSTAYAYFNIILANLGSFLFNGCYTQRLLENWHIGTNWYGAMAENEWPHSKDDKIVDAFPSFDLFTHIKNPEGSYHLFTSWSNMRYLTRETGGVRSTKKTDAFAFDATSPSERYRSSWPLLLESHMENKIDNNKQVMHKDLRRNFYLYHHYELSKTVQLYHELHYIRKRNLFTCKDLSRSLGSLQSFISIANAHDVSSTKQENCLITKSLGNEIGIKGDLTKSDLFYAAYYRVEDKYMNYDFFNEPKKEEEKEHYLGGNVRLEVTQHRKICTDGEYLAQKGGYHKLNLAYHDKFFKIAYHTIKHKVPYIVSHGYSSYRLWDKHFVAPSAQAIEVGAWYQSPHVTVHPILSFKAINNHLYYRKAKSIKYQDHCVSEPVQATTPIYLLSMENNLNFCFFSYFHFDNTLTILKELSRGVKVFKGYMPPYMYTGRYYYADQLYDKKMDIETGLNIHFKALYYGDGYDLVAQQFYRQNKFPVQGKPIADIFCNIRVNNLKLSFKYSYINESLNKPKAYFATPFYPGLKKAADIGIHWSFFD